MEIKPIGDLPNNGVSVMLMRRTGAKTVKVSVGTRGADGAIYGWYGSRAPTHFSPMIPYADAKK